MCRPSLAGRVPSAAYADCIVCMPTLICSCSEEHYTRKHDTFLRSFVRTYSELTPQKILDKLLDDHHDQYKASDSKKLRRQITRLRAKVYESRNGRAGNLNNTFARIHSKCGQLALSTANTTGTGLH